MGKISAIKERLLGSNLRSAKAKKNILASFVNKGLAIVISLLLIPVTIDYLDPEQYGIWLTLSSIVAWISYFDVGLGHGFRNRFAEAKARGDDDLAQKYVSTSYATLILIFGCILIITEMVNPLLDWSSMLNVNTSNIVLQKVVSILLIGVCVHFVVNLSNIMLSADQRPALSAIISTISQGVALIIIYILTQTTESNMSYIAFALSWIPCVIILISTLYLFTHKYKLYRPTLQGIDFSLIKNIIGLGGKFFAIQLSMLLIFQVVNVILSRIQGPSAVAEYNIAYKYFSITQMVYNIILAPFWSAYTDAYTKGDYIWMRNIHAKLQRIWLLLLSINSIMLALSPIAYNIWLQGKVEITWSVSITMCIYLSVLSISNMYMILLNGIGKVFVQMIIYIICACTSIPLCVFLCRWLGTAGVLIVLTSVYLIQAIFARYQLSLLLKESAKGIWNR